MVDLITENLDLWSSAYIAKKTAGRGSSTRSDAYGIQKLRELILELAVCGKLLPQDSNDEPASRLLEIMEKEKKRLIKEKVIRLSKKLPPIASNEIPFALPAGWQYVRLNDIGDWGAGATPTRGVMKYYGGDIPWFKSGELVGDYISESEEYVTEQALQEISLRYNKKGDVLIAMYGATIGKTSILEVPATTNQAVCACTPFQGLDNTYLLLLLKAYKSRFIAMGAGGAQPNISREKIIATVIALPPKEEQKRIVAKVDELMALCDHLEEQQNENSEAHQTLVETLLSTLISVKGIEEFQKSWNQIAEHFDILFTTEQSIDTLKQTILQLAVMGKLVPQDPNDEPATVLLKKIALEKERFIEEGKIKKQAKLSEISEDEKVFEIPSGWEWIKLHDIAFQITDGAHHTPNYVYEGVPFLSVKDMSSGQLDFSDTRYISKEQHNELIKRCNPQQGDLLLTKIGTTGIPVLIETDKEFSIFVSVALIKFSQTLISGKFLSWLLKSPFVKAQSDEGTEGVGNKNLVLRKISAFSLTLPPLEEQRRIVAKVDELIALCDTLKQRIEDTRSTQIHLADAIVEQAVNRA